LVLIAMSIACTAFAGAPQRMVLVTVDGLPLASERPGFVMPALATAGEAQAAGAEPFPAWVELLSGCEPARTGVWDETAVVPSAVGGRWPSLAAALTAAGYHALALPADPLSHAGTQLAAGFERYDVASPALTERARVDSALAWLDRPGRRFAWLAFSMGAPPEPWRRTDGIGPRDPAERATRRATVDTALARLSAGLAALDREGVTVVVIAGTGASDGTAVRVPLAFSGSPTRALNPGDDVRLADVAPTMVGIAGGRPPRFDGVDLGTRRTAARATRREAPADTLALPVAARAAFEELTAANGRPDSVSLVAWDSLCARFPASARLALERAVAQSRGGREVLAAQTLKAMTTAMPGDPRPALAYADHLMRYRRGAIAADVLDAIDPDSPFAALAAWRRALAHASLEDFLAAEGDARRAAKLMVPNATAAEMPERLHALAALHDSCGRAPRDGATRLRYGRALGDFGLVATAYSQFHSARAMLPGSAEPDYWLAFYLLRENRPQHAQPTLERALARDSTYAPARHALAQALLEQGKRVEGRRQLERLATTSDLDAREWYNLACLRSGDGATDAALEALRRAIAAGYSDWATLASDPDLAALRTDPRFPKR
jgi:tetratricopeptide (TPR) repeat protein